MIRKHQVDVTNYSKCDECIYQHYNLYVDLSLQGK